MKKIFKVKKTKKYKTLMDRSLGQMVKAKLYRQIYLQQPGHGSNLSVHHRMNG